MSHKEVYWFWLAYGQSSFFSVSSIALICRPNTCRRFARIGHGVFEESRAEESEAVLVEAIRNLDKDKSISKAFVDNQTNENIPEEGMQYNLNDTVLTELVGVIGAFLTHENED